MEGEAAEKALALWLNTVWGVLAILANRQETRGRWASLKIAQWRLLPVLDVSRVDCDTLNRLAQVFDSHAAKPLKRLPQQFNPESPDPSRLSIDLGFLQAVDPSLDEREARRALLEVYRRLNLTLKTWIR